MSLKVPAARVASGAGGCMPAIHAVLTVRSPALAWSALDTVACRAEGQGIDMDDADAAQVALAARPPAAILAMDDTGARSTHGAMAGDPYRHR